MQDQLYMYVLSFFFFWIFFLFREQKVGKNFFFFFFLESSKVAVYSSLENYILHTSPFMC
jgi:hypothetical protein